jgi:cytoskeletal protein RodZ
MAEDLDPKVSQRYRELGAEEPPRELDQAILAAAHRSADRPHAPLVAPAGRHRWYFAFGAVAILVLAVAVTVQVERQQPDPEALPADSAPAVSEPKAPETRKKPAQTPAPAKPQPAENAARPQAAEVARADRLEARPEQPAAQPEKKEQSAVAEAPSPRLAQRAPAAQAPAAPQVLSSAVALNPEQLLERIAELRKGGRHEEADKALAEFRQRYPDYRMSEEMLKKVERPK